MDGNKASNALQGRVRTSKKLMWQNEISKMNDW